MKTLFAAVVVCCLAIPQVSRATPVACSQSDCSTTCQQRVSELGAPLATRTTFTGARCSQFNSGQGSRFACYCDLGNGGSYVLTDTAPTPVDAGADTCWRFGRNHQCLYRFGELPMCSVEGPSTVCTNACADLQARIQTDEAASYTVSVHGALCRGPTCACVIKHSTGCFVNNLERSHDCSLTPQQIAESLGGCGCSVAGGKPEGALALGWIVFGLSIAAFRRRRDAQG